MTWNDIVRKLTSRKLWLAIAGVATGIAAILVADASEIQTVAGAVVSLVSAVAYIIVEGKVDAASVQNTVLTVEDALEVPENED